MADWPSDVPDEEETLALLYKPRSQWPAVMYQIWDSLSDLEQQAWENSSWRAVGERALVAVIRLRWAWVTRPAVTNEVDVAALEDLIEEVDQVLEALPRAAGAPEEPAALGLALEALRASLVKAAVEVSAFDAQPDAELFRSQVRFTPKLHRPPALPKRPPRLWVFSMLALALGWFLWAVAAPTDDAGSEVTFLAELSTDSVRVLGVSSQQPALFISRRSGGFTDAEQELIGEAGKVHQMRLHVLSSHWLELVPSGWALPQPGPQADLDGGIPLP